MSLDLTLFQIEDGLRDLYAMREEAREAVQNCIGGRVSSNDAGETSPLQEAEAELEQIDKAISLYIGAEIKKTDGVADFILMLDRLCHEQRERKGSVERCDLDQEIDRLKARRDSLRGVLAHVKDAVKFVMEGMSWREGKPKKLEGVRHSITLRGNGGAQPVEITDESLIPDEYCRVTVTMTFDRWLEISPMFSQQFRDEIKLGPREVSRSAIAEALAKPCPQCHGLPLGTQSRINPAMSNPQVTCADCGGSGTAGVPGARLAERGSSVVVK